MKDNVLQKIQAELKVPKGQFNKFGGYKYRSCEDILEAAKPILAKYNASLKLHDDIAEIGGRNYIKATTELEWFDGKEWIIATTSAFAREPENKKGMDESQITGAASSYARKYALNGLFCLDDTKDADTQDNSHVGETGMTDKQRVLLKNMLKEFGIDERAIVIKLGEIRTSKEASEAIDKVKMALDKRRSKDIAPEEINQDEINNFFGDME